MTKSKTGRKPNSGHYKKLVGKRMKMAAEQAGYQNTVAMGEALGVPNSTVWRYWNGEHLPDADQMAHYAAVVDKPIWWFWIDGDDSAFERLAESLVAIVDRVMAGEDVAAAHSHVTHDGGRFGARERATLAAGTPGLREAVTRAAGGEWQRQTPRRRRRAVDALAAEALRDQVE